MSGGRITNFTLANGSSNNIIITGTNTASYINLGLDGSSADYVDIISRYIEVSGDIHSRGELNIKTGNDKYNYDTKTVTSDASITTDKPSFGLDSSYLGGMYAGKIQIVSSEAGVGVRTRGDLVSNVSDINLEAQGDIKYERLQSANDINITSTNGDIIQRDLTDTYLDPEIDSLAYSNNNITIIANNGDIDLNGEYLFANNNVNLSSTNNIINNTEITANNNINIIANNFTNNKRVIAFNDLNTLIYTNLLNQNGGLLFAGNNINMQVNGDLTNDASEIYAFNNIYLNGEKYETTYGNVSKYDFFWISFDKSDEIWDDLIAKGWVDEFGDLTDAFKELTSYNSLTLDSTLSAYQENIYRTLDALSQKVATDGGDFQIVIQRNFDDKAADIYNALVAQGYIDENDELTKKFHDDTATLGSEGLVLDDVDLDCCFKDDVYHLLTSARTGLIIENIFLNIDPDIDSETLMSNLKNNGYVDQDGNATSAFTDLASFNDLNIDDTFDAKLEEIYNQINNTLNIGKVAAHDFNAISVTANNSDLFSELITQGYIDSDGNIQGSFTGNIEDFNVTTDLSEFKDQLFNIVKTLHDASDVVELTDLTSVTATADQNDIITYLTDNNYIDELGNVTGLYYSDGLTVSGSLAIYHSDVNSALSAIQKENLNTNSFKRITKSLDSSVHRLLAELQSAGYVDQYGKKTDVFTNLANSGELSLSDEFAANQALIYNTIDGKAASYKLSGADFLGGSFDTSTFFDENQELFDDLVANNYLTTNGDVKKSFYDLEGDYTGLNTNSKFTALQGKIGEFLEGISKANITKTNLSAVAQENTKTQAELIFNKLYEKGYVDIKGDYTQKLMDDVLNYSANDVLNYNQLELDDLNEHAEGVYNSLKTNNRILEVMTAGNSINNLNGGRIESLFGDVFIKTKTLNNIGKDSIDVTIASNIESALTGRRYDNLRSAWKNTVLDSRDYLTSTLTSNESYLIAANNMDIEADSFLNNSSWITAANDMDIRATNLKNKRTEFTASARYLYESHWKRCSGGGWSVSWSCRERRWHSTSWVKTFLQSNTVSILSAGNNLTINAINTVKNDTPTEDNASLPIAPESAYSDVNDASDSGEYTVTLPSNENGLFRKAGPTSDYLVETNLRFLDSDILTGSKYFKDRFGYDPNVDGTRFLGDPFYEWKIVNDQIRAATKTQKQWNKLGWSDNLNDLIDNAFNVAKDLELVPGIKLTANQIANLDKDIIWYEEKMIDGQMVSVPTVYLANNSFNTLDLNNGSMILAKNLTIKSNDIANQGNLLAENNLDLEVENNVTNNGGNIHAQNNATITSGNDITNTAIVNTVRIGNDIFSEQARSSFITSGNHLSLNAGNDFNNRAANIVSGGDLTITAGDDINIETMAVRNRTEMHWGNKKKGGVSINDVITNLSSNITSAGNLSLTTTGEGEDGEMLIAQENYQKALDQYDVVLEKYHKDYTDYQIALSNYEANKNTASFSRKLAKPTPPTKPIKPLLASFTANTGSNINIVGSNITTTNDLTINSYDNTSIANAVDSNYFFSQTSKKGITKFSRSTQIDYVEKAVNSNLVASNITINSGNNILVQGSNLNSRGDVGASIKGDTNLNAAGNTVITGAILEEYHHSSKQKGLRGVFATVMDIVQPIANLGLKVIDANIDALVPVSKLFGVKDDLDKINSKLAKENESIKKSLQSATVVTNSRSNPDGSTSITANNVTINANDDITNKDVSHITADNDITFTAHNGSITNTSLLIAGGNVALNAAKNITNASVVETNDRDLLNSDNPAYVSNGKEASNSNISSKLTEIALIKGNKITINAGEDFRNYGANIEAAEDLDIIAGDDITIETVQVRNRSESHSKKHVSIKDIIKNNASNITSGGTINLTANGTGIDQELLDSQAKFDAAQDQYETDLENYETALANYELALSKWESIAPQFKSKMFGEPFYKKPTAPTKPEEPIFANYLEDNVGSGIRIIGSNITAQEELNLNANNNIIIANAVDSDFSFVRNTKKGSLKKVRTTTVDYVETAVNSNLVAKNINVNSGNNILIQGSNVDSKFDQTTQSGGNTNLNAANDVKITNALLTEYHHASKEKANRGLFKGITAITSAVGGLGMLSLQMVINSMNMIAKAVGQEDAAKSVSRPLKKAYKDNSLYTTKTKSADKHDMTKVASSNISADNNLTITSNQNTTVIASNLISGKADPKNTNANIEGKLEINAENLTVMAAMTSNINSSKDVTGATFSIKTHTKGDMSTDFTNSNLTAKNDNFTYNITNQADIRAKDLNDPILEEPAYLVALKEQLSPENINAVTLEIMNKNWDDTSRELTEAAIATAVIVIVVATILTAGAAGAAAGTVGAAGGAAVGTAGGAAVGTMAAGAGIATAAGTAVGGGLLGTMVTAGVIAGISSVATTVVLAGAQASMNADGDAWKQAKTIGKKSWDESTSRDAIESYVIASATAALTAGATKWADASLLNGAIAAGNTTTATLPEQITSALAESAISTTTSTAAQSALHGDSFGEALESQALNIVIGAVGNLGAKQIGGAFHTGKINKPTQLALHAGLGCGTATAGGGDCASGAVSGVVGELAGELALKNGANNMTIKEISGLAGGLSAIFTGNAVGLDESEVAQNIYSGQAIGKNAAENNLLYIPKKGYFTEPGDTVQSIARDTGFSEKEIRRLNPNLPDESTQATKVNVPDNVRINTFENAADQIGSKEYAFHNVLTGEKSNKCNSFVASCISSAGGSYPVRIRTGLRSIKNIWDSDSPISANQWGSNNQQEGNYFLTNYNSALPGDTISLPAGNTNNNSSGHTGIFTGNINVPDINNDNILKNNALIGAGKYTVNINTLEYYRIQRYPNPVFRTNKIQK